MRDRYYRRSGPRPACVADFMERTKPATATIKAEMGQLVDEGINEKEFFNLCTHFANGVQYISDQHKIAPDRIEFRDHLIEKGDEPDGSRKLQFNEGDIEAYYDPETKALVISRAWLKDALRNTEREYYADSENYEHRIGVEDYTFLLGVEEAHHHYYSYGGARAARKGAAKSDEHYDSTDMVAYRGDPGERAAHRAVMQAAHTLGMTKGQGTAELYP